MNQGSNTRIARCSAGRDLLLELKRGGGGGFAGNGSARDDGTVVLPPYNSKLVGECLEELNFTVQSMHEEIQAMTGGESSSLAANKKPSMSVRPSLLLHHAVIQRHKRCLLAYHKRRMDMLQQHVQNHPNLVTDPEENENGQQNDDAVLNSCNLHEMEFVQEYQQLRKQYSNAIFELGKLPPTSSSMVQVRVVLPPTSSLSKRTFNNIDENNINGSNSTDGGNDGSFWNDDIVLESGRTIRFIPGSVHYLPLADVEDYVYDGKLEIIDGEEHVAF